MDYKNIFRIFTVDSLKRQAADAAGKVQHINNYLSNNEDKWLQANLASLVCMSGFFTNPNGFALRDSIMFNNLCLQVRDHKAIVWAANQHLGSTSFWMGNYIRRRRGQEYFYIGIVDRIDTTDKYNTVVLELLYRPTPNMDAMISVMAKEIPFATVL
jgi:hypothetical protein